MPERWVLNASPLIVLARISREDLFFALANEVVVPLAVASEIRAGPSEDRARQVVEAGRFRIIETPVPSTELSNWDLGSGETAVLSFAMTEGGWTAILDDAQARKCARSFSVPYKGTLALVVMAKLRGLIPSAGDVVRLLKANGFRLDDETIRAALKRLAGEEWSA